MEPEVFFTLLRVSDNDNHLQGYPKVPMISQKRISKKRSLTLQLFFGGVKGNNSPLEVHGIERDKK